MQHVDRVFRTVRGMLRSDADAEDVTQDAMLTVLTSLNKYRPRPDARFAAWVTTIAVNTARRRFRRRRPELTATGELPDTPDDGADPADALDRARQRRALLIALAELPERERMIVSLRYGAELNASEIGIAVGIEPATVRKMLERARTRLGERIEALLSPDGGRVMNDEEFGASGRHFSRRRASAGASTGASLRGSTHAIRRWRRSGSDCSASRRSPRSVLSR